MARTNTPERARTLTEQARSAQLIEATIDLVAEHGHQGTSLARIAEAAGITKGAVLYHFPSKNAVVEAAWEHVLRELVTTVATAVEASPPDLAPAAYIRSMTGHLRDRPRHTRMIIEGLVHGNRPETADRWKDLAALMRTARQARGLPPAAHDRPLAVIVCGGIDAIVAQRLSDPGFDSEAAAEHLVSMLEGALFA